MTPEEQVSWNLRVKHAEATIAINKELNLLRQFLQKARDIIAFEAETTVYYSLEAAVQEYDDCMTGNRGSRK